MKETWKKFLKTGKIDDYLKYKSEESKELFPFSEVEKKDERRNCSKGSRLQGK